MCDGLRALFSQVDNGLRDMSPSSRGLIPRYPTAFHDRVEALPDVCPNNDCFRSAEVVALRAHVTALTSGLAQPRPSGKTAVPSGH